MKKPLRTIFHGLRHEHAPGKLNTLGMLKDEFKIVAAVDDLGSSTPTWPMKRTRPDVPALEGVPLVSAAEALAMPDIDVVFVETANGDLVETARPWAERGVAMHLDKPTGETREPFRELVAVCRAKNVPLQMGYMFRANPGIQFVQRAVREGIMGKVVSVVADMNHSYGDDEYQRYVSTFNAGIFYNLACHLIDFIVPMMDGDIEKATLSVGAAAGDPPRSRNRCTALLEWPAATASLRVCSRVPAGSNRRRLVVEGTNGVFEMEKIEHFDGKPLTASLFLGKAAGGYETGSNALDFGPQKDRYIGQLKELAAIVRGELPNDPALYDHDLRVHEALQKAIGA